MRYGIGCQALRFVFVGVCRARASARARTCRSLRGRDPAGYGRLDSEEAASARWPPTAAWANAARDLLRLARRAQALIERLDGRVVAGGAEGRHVQGGAQPAVAVVADAWLTAETAARLARHRGQPGV